MSSFIEKLKGSSAKENVASGQQMGELPSGTAELGVDVYRLDSQIIIVAQTPGATKETLDVAIGEDGDVVTITCVCKGTEEIDHILQDKNTLQSRTELVRECRWGSFFRKIVLPRPIDASRARMRLSNGILTIELPIQHDVVRARQIKSKIEERKDASEKNRKEFLKKWKKA